MLLTLALNPQRHFLSFRHDCSASPHTGGQGLSGQPEIRSQILILQIPVQEAGLAWPVSFSPTSQPPEWDKGDAYARAHAVIPTVADRHGSEKDRPPSLTCPGMP